MLTGPTCDADTRQGVQARDNAFLRMFAGPTCNSDMRKQGGKCEFRTRVTRLRPWRMFAGPTHDSDMRPREENYGRETRLARDFRKKIKRGGSSRPDRKEMQVTGGEKWQSGKQSVPSNELVKRGKE